MCSCTQRSHHTTSTVSAIVPPCKPHTTSPAPAVAPVGVHVTTAWICDDQVNAGASHATNVTENHSPTTNKVVLTETSEGQRGSSSTSEVSCKICSLSSVLPSATRSLHISTTASAVRFATVRPTSRRASTRLANATWESSSRFHCCQGTLEDEHAVRVSGPVRHKEGVTVAEKECDR